MKRYSANVWETLIEALEELRKKSVETEHVENEQAGRVEE